jgi:hypothetical protein
MDSFGRIVLHEMLLVVPNFTGPLYLIRTDLIWSIISCRKDVDLPFEDLGGDDHNLHGVCGARKLLRLSLGSAKVNADSYTWLAQVCYAPLQTPRFLQIFLVGRFLHLSSHSLGVLLAATCKTRSPLAWVLVTGTLETFAGGPQLKKGGGSGKLGIAGTYIRYQLSLGAAQT